MFNSCLGSAIRHIAQKIPCAVCKDGLKPIYFHGRKDYLRTNKYLYSAEILHCRYAEKHDVIVTNFTAGMRWMNRCYENLFTPPTTLTCVSSGRMHAGCFNHPKLTVFLFHLLQHLFTFGNTMRGNWRSGWYRLTISDWPTLSCRKHIETISTTINL